MDRYSADATGLVPLVFDDHDVDHSILRASTAICLHEYSISSGTSIHSVSG